MYPSFPKAHPRIGRSRLDVANLLARITQHTLYDQEALAVSLAHRSSLITVSLNLAAATLRN